jgi:hypothetical protein
MTRSARFLLVAGTLILLFSRPSIAKPPHSPGPVARTILALYNSREEVEVYHTRIHRVAEMPLNYLGLVVRYWNIQSGLPPAAETESIAGVLTWFQSDSMPDPQGFLAWAESLMSSGKKFVMLGEPSVSLDSSGRRTPLGAINRFMARLGVRNESDWTAVTYDARIVYKDPSIVEFERSFGGVLPPFDQLSIIDPRARSFLTLRRGNSPNSDTHLVVISPSGGYIASGYALYKGPEVQWQQLYVNLFEFFRLAFKTDEVPKPDPTTLCGRRIYYSHIDGDGWRNRTELEQYRSSGELSAKVILDRALKTYPDLPFTVAPIAADLDPEWYGDRRGVEIARAIFALPNVEAGSHTYSHPLFWEFFLKGSYEDEMRLVRQGRKAFRPVKEVNDAYMHGHEQPRSYYLRPFRLDTEIAGSVSFIGSLLPPGKRVEVYQWSGDTLPFAQAIASLRRLGLPNINGGDTRFDPDFPSYAWVSPLGRQVGDEWQIYASNSNENTYTDLWTDRFFGFRNLTYTLENTESPRRIKPINVYCHMYSGQRLASLNALRQNLDYVRTLEIIPITTSNYAAVAAGFYSTRIVKLNGRSWSIANRGALQTIRFDEADNLGVDFRRSAGVIGQRRHQGSLYVSLDEAQENPIVSLQAGPPEEPFLVQSRWKVFNVQTGKDLLSFSASGYGAGDMAWKMPVEGRYSIRLVLPRGGTQLETFSSSDGLLRFSLPSVGAAPVRVEISRSPISGI